VIKRIFDATAAAVGLALVAPLFVVIALAVKLGSAGPVFFRQERMGQNFRPFRIYKFRTMVADAPKLGGQITAGADPRITSVGRILRKSKLDELPQLINVLAGDMSLVGPRPEVPRYVELFRDDYRTVLSVRPGITDLASVKYRDENELLGGAADPDRVYIEQILPDKIALAKEYIARQSLIYDVGLILQTLLKIVK
jgi:lipopolysaccharide/colanic/teichoic acid biosynthesis glycosyltransferase